MIASACASMAITSAFRTGDPDLVAGTTRAALNHLDDVTIIHFEVKD